MKLSTILVALKLMLLAVQALAVDQSPHCRIRVHEGNGVYSCGSGTLVGNFKNCGMVVTCWHIFSDSQADINCEFANGHAYRAIIVGRDPSHDLAVLQIKKPNIRGVEFTDEKAEPKRVTVCGYGSGRFRHASGPVIGQEIAGGATYRHRIANVAVRSGDSGGGVLDEHGRLAGVVWGCTEGQTRYFAGEPFWKIVKQTQCYNGQCSPPVYYRPSRPIYRVPSSPPPPALPPENDPPPAPEPEQSACDCAGKWDKLETIVKQQNASIAALTAKVDAQAAALADVNVSQAVNQYFDENPVEDPPTAEDIAKQLTHSAEWRRLDGRVERQTRPLSEPLKFQSERVGIR